MTGKRKQGRRPSAVVAARSRRRLLVVGGGLAAAFVIVGFLWSAIQRSDRIGGPYRLINEKGQPVSSQAFHGKYQLIYFGYTHCTDVCPLTLAHMTTALEHLGPAARRIVPIFITIDPKRDTPRAMRKFTARFSKRIIGLTGSSEQIAEVAGEFHVFYRRAPERSETTGYAMDHSTSLYLMAPNGTLVQVIQASITVSRLVSLLRHAIPQPDRSAS